MTLNFPCLICQFIYDGQFLWNIHGTSLTEDRHMLCTPCLIKFADKNIICPLRCGNPFTPLQLNLGYKKLVTRANKEFIEQFPNETCIPSESNIKNQKIWLELIDNIENYVALDQFPTVYGWGKFRHLTYFMSTLKSNCFHKNIGKILELKQQDFSEDLDIKVGLKRKLEEIEYNNIQDNEDEEIEVNINDILEHINRSN